MWLRPSALQKHEVIETYNQIAIFFDAELEEALAPTPPLLVTHSLGYRCDASYNIANIADKLKRLVANKNFTMKGAAVRARCEQPPERRSMWQVLYSNLDSIKQHLADDKWAKRGRSMSQCSMPTFDLVGGSSGAY